MATILVRSIRDICMVTHAMNSRDEDETCQHEINHPTQLRV